MRTHWRRLYRTPWQQLWPAVSSQYQEAQPLTLPVTNWYMHNEKCQKLKPWSHRRKGLRWDLPRTTDSLEEVRHDQGQDNCFLQECLSFMQLSDVIPEEKQDALKHHWPIQSKKSITTHQWTFGCRWTISRSRFSTRSLSYPDGSNFFSPSSWGFSFGFPWRENK